MVDYSAIIGSAQQEAGNGWRGRHQVYSTTDNIKATVGGGQLQNANLNGIINRVTTVTSPGDSGTLPVGDQGKIVVVISTSSTQMNIFPDVGGQINNLGTNAAYSLTGSAAGKCVMFFCTAKGQWYALLSA